MITQFSSTMPERALAHIAVPVVKAKTSAALNKAISRRQLGHANTPLELATRLRKVRENESTPVPSLSSYACFLKGTKVLEIQRLVFIRGYNPTIKLDAVIKKANELHADGIVLATWQKPNLERPWALEQDEEVLRQYTELKATGHSLVDHIRISDTGTYSYYASTQGPFHYQHTPTEAKDLKCLY